MSEKTANREGAMARKSPSVESASSRLRAFAVGSCLFAACGYAPVKRAQPALRVVEVRNDTALAEAGGIFAAELRTELAGRGRLDESETAPPLKTELISIRSLPTTAGTEGGSAFQVQVVMAASATGWSDQMAGSEDYLAGIDVLGTEANRRAALRRLARSLAREAIERYDVAQRLK